MDICSSNKAVSLEVKNFMLNVGDVKEESITDYLVWKWRELDKRFNYLSVTSFDRHQESATTGADFDLELWLVGRKEHVSLAVQAKKFIKQHDSYIKKLNYPNGTKQQLNTPLTYSAANNKLPFYFIYTIAGVQTTTMCGRSNTVDSAIFMTDARVIRAFADGKKGKRASRDDLVRAGNPFHCMFCCPLAKDGSYFQNYFSASSSDASPRSNELLPNYVRELLAAGRDQPDRLGRSAEPTTNREGWNAFRAVGVYDLRE
jgi:hypothetical protein